MKALIGHNFVGVSISSLRGRHNVNFRATPEFSGLFNMDHFGAEFGSV